MRIFFKKIVQKEKVNNNVKKTVFKIIKGSNGVFEQIQGISLNGDTFHVKQNIVKKNSKSGTLSSKHRVFKIKSSNLKELLTESKNSVKKDNHIRHIDIDIVKKIDVKKDKPIKIDIKKDKPLKKIDVKKDKPIRHKKD